MFSKLIQNVRKFLSWPGLIVGDSNSLAADRQIQTDLAVAADNSMVATRLQDHTSPGTGMVKDGEVATPKSATRKRKYEDGPSSTRKQSLSKRRQTDSESSTHLIDTPTRPSSTSDPTRITRPITTLDVDVTLENENDMMNDTEPSQYHGKLSVAEILEARIDPVDDPTSVSQATNSHDTSIGVDDSKEISSADTLVNEQESDELNQGRTPVIKKRMTGVKSKDDAKLQKRAKSSKQVEHESNIGHVVNGTMTKVPIHKRFGSEEPIVEIPAKLPLSQASGVKADTDTGHFTTIDDDSEDDAPETISAAAGLSQSRKAAADTAKAVERQENSDRKKRQSLDARLKEQAKSAKRQKRNHTTASLESELDAAVDAPLDVPIESDNSRMKATFNSKNTLPLHLPDEILAAEPVIRLPTPPPDLLTSKSNKHRFVEIEPKPPRDIKHGSIRLRVLEDNTSTLPPRTSKASKSLKESWLAGRRGPQGGAGSLRRKVGGGFVRR